MKNTTSDEPVDIALIGYQGAGKTTLAVGLYATVTPKFTVTCDGEDTETYLRGRKAMMESGSWPHRTKEQDRPDLRLNIQRAGRPSARIQFREYMGELAKNPENYKRDVIGDPQGALILLNPKMEELKDVRKRVEMLGQIREIIGYLAAETRCVSIALVTTACDYLEECDPEFRTEFESYKDEIANGLRTSNRFVEDRTWKEFSVTVSGKLQDQMRPRIAKGEQNTARDPFLWVLDSLENSAKAARRLRRLKQTLVFSAVALVVGVVGMSTWFFWTDRSAERNLREKHAFLCDKLKSGIVAAKDGGKVADLGEVCNDIEKEVKAAESRLPFFSANARRLEGLIKDLRQQNESGRRAYYLAFLRENESNAAQKASEENCRSWRKTIESWNPISEDGQSLRERLLKEFDEKKPGMRTAYEKRVYEEKKASLLSDLRNFKFEGDFGGRLQDHLKDCRRFERMAAKPEAHELVPFDIRTNAWSLVRTGRADVLDRLADWKAMSYPVDGAMRPELGDSDRKKLDRIVADDDVLSPSDRTAWYGVLDGKIAKRQREWEKIQNEKCQKFIVKWKSSGQAYNAVVDFRRFYQEYPFAPDLFKVAEMLNDVVGERFVDLVSDLKGGNLEDRALRQNFTDIRLLCEAMIPVQCPLVKASCWYAFASNCCERGNIRKGIGEAFRQRYTVTQLDATWRADSLYDKPQEFRFELCFSSLADGQYSNLGDVKSCSTSITLGKNDWRKVWEGELRGEGSPWQPMRFTVRGLTDYIDVRWRYKENRGKNTPSEVSDWEPYRMYEHNWTGDDTDVTTTIRIHVKGEGDCIWDYLPQNAGLERK